jgi:hypothetical protein
MSAVVHKCWDKLQRDTFFTLVLRAEGQGVTLGSGISLFVVYFSYRLQDAMFQSMVYWVVGALADDASSFLSHDSVKNNYPWSP